MSDGTTATRGLLLCDDLIFTSRVAGTARALGLDLAVARTQEQLLGLAAASAPPCVILDLHTPGLTVGDVVAALRVGDRPPFLVGYGSHVDTATLKAARAAGVDVVLPRSKFVEDLPAALPDWFAGQG